MRPMSTMSPTITAMTGPRRDFSDPVVVVVTGGTGGTATAVRSAGTALATWVVSGIVVTTAVTAVPTTAWPRRKRMRSARRSSADWYRSFGSLARHVRMTRSSSVGSVGTCWLGGITSSRTCLYATVTG